MSTLLREAIVDATALREAALKNAEATIIEKYSDEVRNVLDTLLEQDEEPMEAPPEPMGAEPMGGMDMGMDMGMGAEEGGPAGEIAEDVPLGAADGEKLCPCPQEGESASVTVNLDELQETVKQLGSILEEKEEFEFTAAELADILGEGDKPGSPEDPGSFAGEEADEEDEEDDSGAALAGSAAATTADDAAQRGAFQEDLEISDEMLDAIAEKLTVDMEATLSGWAGRGSYDMKWQMEKEFAHRRGTEAHEDLEVLKKAQEELVFENKQLTERTEQYEQVVEELKDNLHEVNISNARLLYTNRVLRNTSLNERQKDKIAEAISKAGSVTEAKTIYQTLENAVPAQSKRAPQSLSEAISRPSSVIRATRQESSQPKDLFLDRMQKLAGIK